MIKRARFDGDAFYAALDGERQARQFTWRRVAEESGVSASTLTRISQGKRPDVDSLAALSAWSGLDVELTGGATDGEAGDVGRPARRRDQGRVQGVVCGSAGHGAGGLA